MTKTTFKTVAVFQYAAEAHIVKSKLESNDIPVFMADHYTIDTDPLVSNAIGGVKIRVRTEDVEKAKAVLSEISPYSLSDEQEPISCPQCNGHQVQMGTAITDFRSLFSFVAGLFLLLLPFYTRYTYRCLQCKHEFNVQ